MELMKMFSGIYIEYCLITLQRCAQYSLCFNSIIDTLSINQLGRIVAPLAEASMGTYLFIIE
jgi:hypothetical protein